MFAAPYRDVVIATITLDGKKLTSVPTPGQDEVAMGKLRDISNKDLWVADPEDTSKTMCISPKTDPQKWFENLPNFYRGDYMWRASCRTRWAKLPDKPVRIKKPASGE